MKDRQHNEQKDKDKRTNNNLQNTTHKTTDRAQRTPLKPGESKVHLKCMQFLLHTASVVLLLLQDL